MAAPPSLTGTAHVISAEVAAVSVAVRLRGEDGTRRGIAATTAVFPSYETELAAVIVMT